MVKQLIATFFSLILLSVSMNASAVSGSDSSLNSRYSTSELSQILRNDGYGSVTIINDSTIQIKIDGKSYVMINEDDGDLRAYYAIVASNVTFEEINEWNRNKRLSRAYLDSDIDPVIETDLLANAGISEKHVTEFFEVFVDSVKEFREFIIEND